MPLLVLEWDVPPPQKKVVCAIWCEEVPPPLGGGPGRLVIPNVTREFSTTGNYEYLSIPRVGGDDGPEGQPPEDICIEKLTNAPTPQNGLILPFNGSPLSEAVSIRLKTCP